MDDFKSLTKEQVLETLEELIYDYDELFDSWIDGEEAGDYCERADELRNTAKTLIGRLREV